MTSEEARDQALEALGVTDPFDKIAIEELLRDIDGLCGDGETLDTSPEVEEKLMQVGRIYTKARGL